MRKRIIPVVLLLATGAGVTAYAATSSLNPQREDCPGKIVCPLTGNLVCEDRCPLGEYVEVDQTELPNCCQTSG